ncbi:MAG: DUF2961 domain-containing protein [Planctomycetota bacterium]|jgi:hypothetical protein
MHKVWMVLAVSVICWNWGCKPARMDSTPESYSYIDLVNQLTDLERLAVLPADGETAGQWSSYSRKSKYDAKNDKYIEWDHNGDGYDHIRKEGDEFVFAEMEGPGVIWRIWSAGPKEGHLKIYLDGDKEPAIDLPFEDYFTKKHKPFNYSSLVHTVAAGKNCYIPIPYQKSCKVTAEKNWGMYYLIDYTTFPKGTKVPTFTQELSEEELKALDETNKKLSKCGFNPGGNRKGEKVERKTITIPASKTVTIAELTGKRAITGIKVTMEPAIRPKDYDTLRELVFSINWDDETNPSVWTPLGDFFGTGPGANMYKSFPMGMTKDGFYSNWYMPFENKAVLKLENQGKSAKKVNFTIHHAPLQRPIKQLGRFHAKWHGDMFLPEREDRQPDWTILKTKGKGRYCGVMLHVWNPLGNWWGEGDEKFFIDGEEFPSFFGTGSEDYFGYAFCVPQLFTNCYHNQTLNEKGNAGHISVNRWHITDNIPFHKSFDGYIEKYFLNSRPTEYDCIAYWYLSPDGQDPYKPAATMKANPPIVKCGIYSYDGIDTKRGAFTGKTKIEMYSQTDGTKIYYTLDGGDPTTKSREYTSPVTIAKTVQVKAKAFKENFVPSSITIVNLTEMTPLEPKKLTNAVNGLNYKVYKGVWSKVPDFSKLKPIETGVVQTPDHSKIEGKDHMGLEFSGYIDVEKKGLYTFYTACDDGSKLYIGGIEVVDNDRCHGTIEECGQISLSPGKHPIKIQMFEAAGFENLEVYYEGPGIKKQKIPGKKLFIEAK